LLVPWRYFLYALAFTGFGVKVQVTGYNINIFKYFQLSSKIDSHATEMIACYQSAFESLAFTTLNDFDTKAAFPN